MRITRKMLRNLQRETQKAWAAVRLADYPAKPEIQDAYQAAADKELAMLKAFTKQVEAERAEEMSKIERVKALAAALYPSLEAK